MISHIFLGITDFDRAFAFHDELMTGLGKQPRFCERDKSWAGWQTEGVPRPLFLIGQPYNGQTHNPGNGQMVALSAANREMVRSVYQAALKRGATCEGPPRIRPHYNENYYGAYFRDPDGNKLCVVCHGSD